MGQVVRESRDLHLVPHLDLVLVLHLLPQLGVPLLHLGDALLGLGELLPELSDLLAQLLELRLPLRDLLLVLRHHGLLHAIRLAHAGSKVPRARTELPDVRHHLLAPSLVVPLPLSSHLQTKEAIDRHVSLVAHLQPLRLLPTVTPLLALLKPRLLHSNALNVLFVCFRLHVVLRQRFQRPLRRTGDPRAVHLVLLHNVTPTKNVTPPQRNQNQRARHCNGLCLGLAVVVL
mmetsp:Transcript_4360/g.12823  ORF Transcript_4360/g.12823 Transcript_4360/m.12823 type:complete len:231 (-) Transcript_4360:164-856(-)